MMRTRTCLLPFLFLLLISACSQQDSSISNAVDKQPEADTETPQITGIELEGMFRYLADAAVFRDCRTGKTFPVSMEGAYMELERAYLNSGIEPGHEIFIELNGRFLERPAMEGNHNKVKLIVDKLNNIKHENNYFNFIKRNDKCNWFCTGK